jgi:hypothetical protein|tara:strand:+ start:84 stop:287 length:204 start_codon:yes stop_codon:yes gene_type:complete
MNLENLLKHRAGIITEEITSQQFVNMVADEFDLETLELMKEAIENQITLITSGQAIATRNPIKGFGQ